MKKINHLWIRFWYNSYTRIFVVLLPSYFIVLIPLLLFLNVPPEYMSNVLTLIYFGVFVWAFIDNDFTNLNKIGRDVDGKPLKKL